MTTTPPPPGSRAHWLPAASVLTVTGSPRSCSRKNARAVCQTSVQATRWAPASSPVRSASLRSIATTRAPSGPAAREASEFIMARACLVAARQHNGPAEDRPDRRGRGRQRRRAGPGGLGLTAARGVRVPLAGAVLEADRGGDPDDRQDREHGGED